MLCRQNTGFWNVKPGGRLMCVYIYIYIYSFIHSLVFGLKGRAWQEPEPSHVTGMALGHCILGKFLGIVCSCFPPYIYIYIYIYVFLLRLSAFVDRMLSFDSYFTIMSRRYAFIVSQN